VWVQFSVFQKDLPFIRSGQRVRVDLGEGLERERGTITYVAPFVDKGTRTTQARVELSNEHGHVRPGLYATVHVDVDPVEGTVVIGRDVVQSIDGEDVVFVETGNGLAPTPVRLGRSDASRVAVLEGLEPGQRYVEDGAFELKAKIVTSGIDPHAGHGH
jgi:cobalt-zinc-cadmium efflux system membrane fusion protein